MIYFIINFYLPLLFAIFMGAVSILGLGLYLLQHIKINYNRARQDTLEGELNNQDFHAIAGEDVFATKLDLARAFIETGKRDSAKQILDNVVKQGNRIQQQEATNLLNQF
ncbi:MAG: hypothetical protein H0W64_02470 [Gammaproteobacteria bacterium]|nr:hypothetical protein [Gammaproteobacteria bacterium]